MNPQLATRFPGSLKVNRAAHAALSAHSSHIASWEFTSLPGKRVAVDIGLSDLEGDAA